MIGTFSELERYLETRAPISVCWYGPKSTDILGLFDLVQISGVITCYGAADFYDGTPVLSLDTGNRRRAASIDSLAARLIEEKSLRTFIDANHISSIFPYDTNLTLERFCSAADVDCLSSTNVLKDELRDKTKIDDISHRIGIAAIPGIPGVIEDFTFHDLQNRFGNPLFLHFAEGSGGTGNYIVYTPESFEYVKQVKRGERLNAKRYETGKSCTIDICVTPKAVLCGPLEEMVIGAEPLNSNPTEYVASSWFENGYSRSTRERIRDIGLAVGRLVRDRGFRGMFHPDFLVVDDTIYLTELNMRFGGSCGTWTRIQRHHKQMPLMLTSLLAFIDGEIDFDEQTINDDFLRPIDYGLLIIKNYFSRPVSVSRNFRSGIYRLQRKRLTFVCDGELEDLGGTEIFINVLSRSRVDTVVDRGAIICELVTRFPISNGRSQLNDDGKALAHAVLYHLIS